MIAIDTNILVRFALGDKADNKSQYEAAESVITKEAFIADSVIAESVWVLSRIYKMTPAECADGLQDIFGLPTVTLENPQRIEAALMWYEDGMDFGDAMNLASAVENGCETMLTFDADFVKKAKGKGTCKVLAATGRAIRGRH